MFCLAVFLLLSTGYMVAQTTQMPKWPLNGKEVNFIGGTVDNTGVSLSTPKFVSNGYYDKDYNPLFYVIDNNLWWGSGSYAGALFTDIDEAQNPDMMFPELIIVPKDTVYCDEGNYYMFYAIKQQVEDEGKSDNYVFNYTLAYNEINPGHSSYQPSEPFYTVDSSIDHSASMGIAVTDFISGTNHRRLYLVYYSSTDEESFIKFFDVSPTGISGPYNVVSYSNNYKLFEPCEVEISRDMSKLAFTRPKYLANTLLDNSNDITIVNLNPSTGYLGTGGIVYKDLGPTNSVLDSYIGLEFTANSQELFITRHNVGLIRYNLLTDQVTTISNTTEISNSQLETGRDGKIYGLNLTGQLYYINDVYNTIVTATQYNLSSSGVINNQIFNGVVPVYTLPEQIDGYDYDRLLGNEDVCCYIWNESEVKTSMSGVSHNPTTGDITITGSNVIWQTTSNPFTSGGQAITDAYLKGKITIVEGAKLTIYGLTLHFKEGESIDMNTASAGIRGPRLYLYSNSKLTVFDECDEDVLWDGINLVGYWGYTQLDVLGVPTRQPKVYMSSGSTIEFAEKGIEVTGGGIVNATLANFKDNIIDVKFNSYSSFGDNISYFSNCNFYTTDELYNKGYNPTYHAHIYNAPGLEFKGCDFYNTNYNYVTYTQWGSGILSSLSSLEVNLYGTSTPSTFSNLNYGIKASGGSYLTLQNSNFTDCVHGSWLIANNAITATSNDFDVSNNSATSNSVYDSFGLYIEASTGYQIEDNNFHDGLLGLVVYASGGADNLVYKNYFEDLSNGTASAFVGIGWNYDTIVKSGLQLRCNSFVNVNYAMAVLGGNIYTQSGSLINVTQSDIRSKQGVLIPSGTDVSAYNYFSGLPFYPYRYLYISSASYIVQTGGKYDYNQTNVVGYRLEYYDHNKINVYNLPAETCASTLGLYMASGIQDIISQTEDYQEYETYLQNELADITNNSLSLFISAQSANSNNASEVYEQLSSSSPNLTSEILLAYLDNPNVPELSKVSLMLENSPLPSDVVEAVEHSDLSPEYIDYILKHQEGINEIEQLQSQIQSLQSARQVNYDHLMRATFNADTVASFSDTYNSVMDFMKTQTDYHAKNRLVDMYIKKGMFEKAMTLLNEMEQIALTSENTAALNDIKLTEIKIDILQNSNTEPVVDIVKRYEEFLTELAGDYNTKEGGVARAILESAGLMENFPIVFLPDPASEIAPKSAFIEQPAEEQPIANYELNSLFNLYPNPANDYLSLEFINPNGNCTFNIYSIKGELLKTISTNQQLGFISINISDLQPGNYIVNCAELQSNVNFVIAR